ncbi:hypothetical protein Trihar35433_227 [Trichoderma harzianum]|nr:hypothetical protein Trihar35433_227 [Trichoderma harzianum]
MQPGQTWDNLPEELVMDLAQLTKANSIEVLTKLLFLPGNKKDNITVIYTPWSNLKKDGSMDVGQVSFHDQRKASHTLPFLHLLHPPLTHTQTLMKHSYLTKSKQVKRVLVPHRENPIVNRLNKTKVEKKPDLKAERDDMLKELRKRDQAAQLIKKKEEQRQAQEWKEKKWQKDHAYDDLFTDENMASSSNQDRAADWEDDFM